MAIAGVKKYISLLSCDIRILLLNFQEQFGGQSEQQLLDAAETVFQRVQPDIGKKFDKLEVCKIQ